MSRRSRNVKEELSKWETVSKITIDIPRLGGLRICKCCITKKLVGKILRSTYAEHNDWPYDINGTGQQYGVNSGSHIKNSAFKDTKKGVIIIMCLKN